MCCEFAALTLRVRSIKPRGVVERRSAFGFALIVPRWGRYRFGFLRLRAWTTSSRCSFSSRFSERQTVERLRLVSRASVSIEGHASRDFEFM